MKYTKTIETPAEIATGPDGEPGVVVFRTRIKGKYQRMLTGDIQALIDAQALEVDIAGQEENEELMERLVHVAERGLQAVDNVSKAMAYIVVDWNWTDIDTGELLPKPDKADVFRDELDQWQMQWLQTRIANLIKLGSTEGNAKSASGSKRSSRPGRTPPEWVKFLYLASIWKQPPWEIEAAAEEDATVNLWIMRAMDIAGMQGKEQRRKNEKARMVMF